MCDAWQHRQETRCSACNRHHKVQRLQEDSQDESTEDARDPQQAAVAAGKLEAEATSLAEVGQLRRAVWLFGKAARLEPQSAKLHEARAQCLLELEEFDEACIAAARAVELQPDWCVAHATNGRALLNAGRLEDAVSSLGLAAAKGKGTVDEEFSSEVCSELAEARQLLERHWSDHHDIVIPLGDTSGVATPARALRIRQFLECKYCNLVGEQGPGGAVWAAGVVLAALISSTSPAAFRPRFVPDDATRPWKGVRVLELGSGTGVGGLAAAAAGAHVLLTDRVPLESTMQMNIDLNRGVVRDSKGCVSCASFDWAAPPPERVTTGDPWDVVLAADLVYSFASVPLVADTLAAVLCDGGAARGAPVIYAHNPRSDQLDSEMRSAFAARGLKVRDVDLPCTLTPAGNIGIQSLRRIVVWVVEASVTTT